MFDAVEDLDADACLNNCVEPAMLNKPTTKNTAFVFINLLSACASTRLPRMGSSGIASTTQAKV